MRPHHPLRLPLPLLLRDVWCRYTNWFSGTKLSLFGWFVLTGRLQGIPRVGFSLGVTIFWIVFYSENELVFLSALLNTNDLRMENFE